MYNWLAEISELHNFHFIILPTFSMSSQFYFLSAIIMYSHITGYNSHLFGVNYKFSIDDSSSPHERRALLHIRGRSQTTFTRSGFFWPPTPLRLHFLWYKSLQKVNFFDHLPPSSCKRSLWTPPNFLIQLLLVVLQ